MAFPAELGSLTDELVEAITSTTTQTGPARYDVLKETSLWKLRQHSFLRTNQFEVYSALDGYEERFRVLNRDGIADAFRDRLDALAECSNKWTPDVLHLLLKLADQPVQKSRLDDLESLNKPEENLEQSLKWSDIAKEDGWNQDGELWQNVDFTGYSSDDDYASQSDISSRSEDASLSSIEARYRKQPTDYLERLPGHSELDQIRKSQSWRRMKPAEQVATGVERIAIGEIQAIREILFIFSGLGNGLSDCQRNSSLDVHLSHASGQIFRSVLASANEAGQKLSVLRQYVKQQQEIPLLQVFQAAIETRLGSFDSVIASMQGHYASIDQDFVVSIMRVLNDLDSHLRPLRFLAGTIEKLEQSKNAEPFHYLELLFDSAQALQMEGDEDVYHFTSQLFFECFAVYLQPIRRWMQSGEIIDSDKTFFVVRSPADIPRSRVWVDQFQLKRTSQGLLFAPRFLQPAASKIFTTGKSVVVLRLLGKNCPTQEETLEPATQIDMNSVSDFAPFSEVFKTVFDRWMQYRHHAASETLKETLFRTYNLWSDLDVIQHIYLMSDGSRSDQFAKAIFRNIDMLNVHWHDRFNLTEIAREAFDGLTESHRLNVSTSRSSAASNIKDVRRSVREGLPSICITYRLPWPSRIVLTDQSLDHYQSVFTFLLQLRRASTVLTRHRIVSDRLANMTTDQEIFYGLRSKLLWFCNTLHSYLSTLVLGPLVDNFLEEMRQVEDIDQMLASHSNFAKQMLVEACLGGKVDPIRQAILDIFNLAIRLRDARQMESTSAAENPERSVISLPVEDESNRSIKANEDGDEMLPGKQDEIMPIQDSEVAYGQVLGEIRSDLDRHLKFICGGLRGVARASSSKAAGKWDILAEMLEVGIR
ncbi:Spc98 family-domain-containing protein [Nemania serpens]|nr:Spc98 family-domain-containing protein [Nemania serpens]